MFTPVRGQNSDFSTPPTVINMEAGLDDTPVFNPLSSLNYSRGNNGSSISDKVSLKKISGFSSENGKNFLMEFESFCLYQNLTTDDRRVAAFHLHLSGPALIWFNSLEIPVKRTWFALKNSFTEQYAKQGMFDPDMVAESAVFEALRLASSQPLEDFHS